MIIKKRLGLLLTLILIVMLSSCSPQTTPLANTAEPSPVAQAASTLPPGLSMRITWTDYSGRGVAIQKIINGYNQTSSTPVAMIGGDEDIQAIQALLDQNAPVVFMLPYRYVKYFGAKGNLMDLTAAFQSEQEYFYPQVWALGGIKGVTYDAAGWRHRISGANPKSDVFQTNIQVHPDCAYDEGRFAGKPV